MKYEVQMTLTVEDIDLLDRILLVLEENDQIEIDKGLIYEIESRAATRTSN